MLGVILGTGIGTMRDEAARVSPLSNGNMVIGEDDCGSGGLSSSSASSREERSIREKGIGM